MIILGVVLLVAGFLLKISILWTLGIILVVIGVILAILGAVGAAPSRAGAISTNPGDRLSPPDGGDVRPGRNG